MKWQAAFVAGSLCLHNATRYNTPQHTATRCNWIKWQAVFVAESICLHSATRCNALQHTATHLFTWIKWQAAFVAQLLCLHSATRCNTLQRTAPGWNDRQCSWLNQRANHTREESFVTNSCALVNFSKVSSTVILYSTSRSDMVFEKF